MLVTDHNLVAVRVRERLSVNKQPTHSIGMERFDVIKLNDAQTEEGDVYKILIRFAAVKNLDANADREEISVKVFKLETVYTHNYDFRQHNALSEEDGCKFSENRQNCLYCIFRVEWVKKPEQR